MIMLLAGLRRGECLGLQWADIDLKRNKINVHQTLVLDGNNSYIKAGAKTEAGVRKVDIPTVLSDYLKSLAPHSPFDYVVTTTKGKLMTCGIPSGQYLLRGAMPTILPCCELNASRFRQLM